MSRKTPQENTGPRLTKAGKIAKKPGPKPRQGVVPHAPRQELTSKDTAHVTLRLERSTPSLHTAEVEEEVREALGRVNEKKLIRIIDYEIVGKRINLTIKAKDAATLSKAMASLNTGLGMRLNRIWDRVGKGSVFQSRYALKVEKG
ncbi:MAG: transposase [Planctomycetota bacterium]